MDVAHAGLSAPLKLSQIGSPLPQMAHIERFYHPRILFHARLTAWDAVGAGSRMPGNGSKTLESLRNLASHTSQDLDRHRLALINAETELNSAEESASKEQLSTLRVLILLRTSSTTTDH